MNIIHYNIRWLANTIGFITHYLYYSRYYYCYYHCYSCYPRAQTFQGRPRCVSVGTSLALAIGVYLSWALKKKKNNYSNVVRETAVRSLGVASDCPEISINIYIITIITYESDLYSGKCFNELEKSLPFCCLCASDNFRNFQHYCVYF
jgi:hypothetical protein